jgi:hypothetical protein
MEVIKNRNGMECILIASDTDSDYSFLKNCKHNQYIVAWQLHEVDNDLWEHEQGYYFDDFNKACACFQKKTAPFDNPCKINAFCQVCNVGCMYRLD